MRHVGGLSAACGNCDRSRGKKRFGEGTGGVGRLLMFRFPPWSSKTRIWGNT